MKISDEFKVGVFASVTIVLLILGFNFLKGKEIFGSSHQLKAQYRKIDGLNKANPVLFYGLQVGKVQEIETSYDASDSLLITVTFSVDPDVKIPKESVARILKPDIMSSMAIEIIPPKQTQGFAQSGDFLKGVNELSLSDQVSAVVTPLRTKSEKLIESLTVTLDMFKETLDADAREDIQTSLANFRKSSGQLSNMLDESAGDFVSIVDDFKSTGQNIRNTSEQLAGTVDDISILTDSLKSAPISSTIRSAKKAVDQISAIITQIESGGGTADKLINDPSLYNDLNKAILSLDSLATDLQAHPKHYFAPLGKKRRKKWAK